MANLCKAARGRECQVRIPGVCNHNPETSCLAHYRLAGTCGTGCKPNDEQGAISCNACHDVIDGRVKTGNDSNLLIVFYVQIMPDDFVMQLHRF
jgi:hypothetical protein